MALDITKRCRSRITVLCFQSRHDGRSVVVEESSARAALEAPLRDLSRRLRAGDPAAVRPSLEFLLADPYCFRSVYLQTELMHRLAKGPALVGRDREDAQAVVLTRVTEPQVRLLRHAAEGCRD